MLFILILHALVIAPIVWVTWVFMRWALLPTYWAVIINLPGIVYVGYICVRVMIETTLDPTSNNLWPIALAIVGATWAMGAAAIWVCLALWGVWRRWQ